MESQDIIDELRAEVEHLKSLLDMKQHASKSDSLIRNYSETVSRMSEFTYHRIIKTSYTADNPILYYLENMYCNLDMPENHNIYIADISRKKGYIFNRGKWNLVNSRQLASDVYLDAFYALYELGRKLFPVEYQEYQDNWYPNNGQDLDQLVCPRNEAYAVPEYVINLLATNKDVCRSKHKA